MVDAVDEELATAQAPNTVPRHVGRSHSQETASKRRKVRKGTRSCWECKRRKIRCIFASSEDETCVGCQHRRAPCVSQEMPEDLSPARKANRHLSARLTRVEDLMKEMLAGKDAVQTSGSEPRPQRDGRSQSDAPESRSDDPGHSPRASFTPADSFTGVPSNLTIPTPDSQHVSGEANIETARRHLLAAFPSEGDAKILLRESSRPTLYASLVNTQPRSTLTSDALGAQPNIAELPGPNTHPVILAKQMLLIAIALQSPDGENIHGLSEPPGALMSRLVAAASAWVTTKEEMHGTAESLICIMLEGVFEINRGSLRRAWAVYRRAMTAAQLMGLHRSSIPRLQRIDPDLDADPEVLWFRIVYMDRYLSLLLGLPQGTLDEKMGALSILQHETPLGRFERQLTVLASRVLERNERHFTTSDIAITHSIDSELLSVSKSMPTSFWRPANFQNLTPGSPETVLETIRLAAQVYYYGLLIQLHLPYMLRAGSNAEHEYSKMTCFNASREIMTRFIAHRSFNPMSFCSRPVDFFALLAGMTLLLAHLDAHHRQEETNFLAHQRLIDRAVLDQALERMDVISQVSKDVVATKSASLIRRLLDIEANAAEGVSFSARAVEGQANAQECTKESEALLLHIPYLGVIKIARQGPISREPSLRDVAPRPHQGSQAGFVQKEPFVAPDAFTSTSQTSSTISKRLNSPGGSFQSSPFLGDLIDLEGPRPPLQASRHQYSYSRLQSPDPSHNDITLMQQGQAFTAADADEWAFQGVDMAFFDSLMRGTSNLDAAGLE